MESPQGIREVSTCLIPSNPSSKAVKREAPALTQPATDYPPPIIAADIDVLKLARTRRCGSHQAGINPDSTSTTRFPHFVFRKVLGTGSFGCVYLAEHKTKATFSAVKVVRKAGMTDSSLKLILNEQIILETLVELRHPFLLQLEESCHDPTSFYLITEYLPGGDLGEMLKLAVDHKFDTERVHFCMTEIVCGTAYLHSIGVVHRDIKPDNIFIDVNGHLVIGDFGLATRISNELEENSCPADVMNDASPPHVRSRRTCGTPGFMAPEIYRQKKHTFAADVWSIGIVMYMMVYGEMPFDGKTMRELIRATLYGVLDLHVFDSNCDGNSMDLLQAFLLKDPLTRITLTRASKHAYFAGVNWNDVEKRAGRVDWTKYVPSPDAASSGRPTERVESTVEFVAGRSYSPGQDPLPDFTFMAPELDVPLRPTILPKAPRAWKAGLCKARRVFSERGNEEDGTRSVRRQEGAYVTSKSTLTKSSSEIAICGGKDEQIKVVCPGPKASLHATPTGLKEGPGSASPRKMALKQPSFLRMFTRDRAHTPWSERRGINGDEGDCQECPPVSPQDRPWIEDYAFNLSELRSWNGDVEEKFRTQKDGAVRGSRIITGEDLNGPSSASWGRRRPLKNLFTWGRRVRRRAY